jgi:hypothetical protein
VKLTTPAPAPDDGLAEGNADGVTRGLNNDAALATDDVNGFGPVLETG